MDTIISSSAEETRRAGEKWGREIARPGSVLALVGVLGAGKTEFVKGLALGLGVRGAITSPTFTLVHEHPIRTGLVFYHVDLYRLEREEEALALGWDELAGPGSVVAVEWADRFPGLFGPETCWIELEEVPGGRRIRARRAS